jgi:hypothetical protein
MPRIKIGSHRINTDAIAHVDDPWRAQHPDRARWKDIGNQGYVDDAIRVQFGQGIEDITLFDEEAQALRDHLDEDVTDLTPERPEGAMELDPITAELDATIGRSGIIDSERLHAATSAGQDRPGAADLRPAGAKSTPPPGASPDAEVIVPARTAGLHETPVEAKGVVAAAETVKADDERRGREAAERAKEAADDAERGAAPTRYPSDRSGEGDKDEPGKLKAEGKPAPAQPESPQKDTGAGKPQGLRSMSDAPVVGRPKEDKPSGHAPGKKH